MASYWSMPDSQGRHQSAAGSLFRASPPQSAPPGYGEIDNSSRASFVRTAWPYMLEASGGDRDAAEMMLAAAISENGRVGTGKEFWANNFYGIKGEGPAGSVTADTHEVVNGRRVDMPDAFAAYHTPQEGFNGFFTFLRENPRYEDALQRYDETRDAERLFYDVTEAGYATDKEWPDKIVNIRRNQVAPVVRDLPVPVPPAPTPEPTTGAGMHAQRPFEQGGEGGLPKGISVIIVDERGARNAGGDMDADVDIPVGDPASFDWRGGIDPSGRGSEDAPLEGTDCSSFIANLIAMLSQGGIRLPAFTDAMEGETAPVDPWEAEPGDIVLNSYQGQGPVKFGHTSMLLDTPPDLPPEEWPVLDQSTAPGPTTGQAGIDIRTANHPGGRMEIRRPIPTDFFERPHVE